MGHYQVLWLMPLVPLGAWLGRRLGDRLDKRTFERIITFLLLVTALLLILGI